jgi:tRNA dimethylallyltransferase
MSKPKVLVIIGPTASGKTDFALHTAELLQKKQNKEVEIVSADSRQVYKHIPIATAQPPKEYLRKIKHHFINELELNKDFNAGEFGKKGRALIAQIFKAGKIPLIAGGSGLYINSLIYGLFETEDVIEEQSDKEKQKIIREKLEQKLEEKGIEKLFDELKKADPETAGKMTNITGRRVIRALEVFYLTGVPISELRSKKIQINFEPVIIGLNWEREELYSRINRRVDNMIVKGLIKEIEKLKKKGYDYKNFNSLNTVGIKEVFDYLDCKTDNSRMLELIKQNTRRFAKRQMTWFRRDKNIKWIDANTVVAE